MLLRMNLWRRGLLLLLGSLSPLPAESSGVMMRMEGIYDGENVNDLLGHRAGDRRQVAQRREEHTDQAQDHAADRALQGNRSHPATNV